MPVGSIAIAAQGRLIALQPYRPRKIRFHGIEPVAGFKLKLYSISHDGAELAWPSFFDGFRLAIPALPNPAKAPGRPGVGFVVAHHGKTADYIVLGWWSNENEMPVRVYVRPPGAGARWRPAREGESFCVWDLEILWAEREAYVETMLGTLAKDPLAAYLDRTAGEFTPGSAILAPLRLG